MPPVTSPPSNYITFIDTLFDSRSARAMSATKGDERDKLMKVDDDEPDEW